LPRSGQITRSIGHHADCVAAEKNVK